METSKQFRFVDERLFKITSQGLHQLYRDQLLCDVSLCVGSEEFPCHKVLLAAASGYFHTMFTSNFVERTSNKVMIHEVDAGSIKTILDFLYSGEVILTSDSVQSLFSAAHMFQLESLEAGCCQFMGMNITRDNCLNFYFFASMYDVHFLRSEAREKICKNFSSVIRSQDFLGLPLDRVTHVLSFSDAKIATELEVYSAAHQWLEHNWTSRKQFVYEVMRTVRFIYLDENFFRHRVRGKPMFKGSDQLQQLFDQVIYFVHHPNRWHELEVIMEPRQYQSAKSTRPVIYPAYSILCTTYPDREVSKCAKRSEILWMPKDLSCPLLATAAGSNELYAINVPVSGRVKSTGAPMYRFTGDEFVRVAPMPHIREDFSLVHGDQFLYAVGGFQKVKDSILDVVERYNRERNQWTKIASIPMRLMGSCAVSFRGHLYVFGGMTSTKKKGSPKKITNTVFCYNPETDLWHTLSPMQHTRVHAGCAVHRNRIYVIGGETEVHSAGAGGSLSQQPLSSVEIYDPFHDTWCQGPELPRSLAYPGVIKYSGTVMVLGGQSGSEYELSREVHSLEGGGGAGGGGGGGAVRWVKQESTLTEAPLSRCNFTPVTLQIPWYSHISNIDSESSIDSLSMDRTPPRNESLSTDSDDSHNNVHEMYSDQTSSDDND